METMLYSVSEVSKILHTNVHYVYSLIHAGVLPALKLGGLKIRREALVKFLAENEGNDLTDPTNICKLDYGN
jgi:excisionase family DNA binding protein